jgi:glycosyltransferase involved in cell wall biosynthesis
MFTIYIPTYNRKIALKDLLESILKIGKYVDSVVISDNFSDDDYVSDLARAYKDQINLITIKRKKNIGARLNILSGFEACRSDYIFLVGDDDVIEPDGFGDIVNNPGLDFYIGVSGNRSGEVITGANLMRNHLYLIGNLGSFVLKRDRIEGFYKDILKDYDGNVWCTSWMYEKLLGGSDIGMFVRPLSSNPLHKRSMAKTGYYYATCLSHMRALRRDMYFVPRLNEEYIRFFLGNLYMMYFCSAYLGDRINVEDCSGKIKLSFFDNILLKVVNLKFSQVLFRITNPFLIMLIKRMDLEAAKRKVHRDVSEEISKRGCSNVRMEKDFF